MSRTLDIPATIKVLQQGGIDTAAAMMRDPNPRRIIEALCIRHEIPAVYRVENAE